jgi:PAS domain S-box-containing protein
MERRKPMQSKQPTERKTSHRVNKKRAKRDGKASAAAFRDGRKSIRPPMRTTTRTRRARRKFSADGAKRPVAKNGAPIRLRRAPGIRNPKTELEAAIQRFVDLYDFAPIAYISFDRAGRIEEANLAATQLLHEPRDLLIGRPFAFYVADLDLFLHHLLYCRTSEKQIKTELQLKPRKGEPILVQLLSTPVTSTTRNGALLYQTAIIDIHERKRHEQQLAEQARLLDLSTDAIIVRDVTDRVTYWNKGATKIYGYTREEALGKVIYGLLKTEFPEPLLKIHEKLLRDNHWEGEIVHTRRDGRRLTVFSRWALDRDAQGNRAYVLETNNDITRRKEAEAALQKSKELLERRVRERTRELQAANKVLKDEIARRKGLEGEILEISDREQQRLGQELHDGLCQHLTAVAFMARSVALRLKNHRVIDAADIEKIADLVNEAASDTRDLSRALHRSDVDAAGLVGALQDLVDREIWKVPCRLEVKPSFHMEDNTAAAQLYRIAREAVINANKHAQAREIVVRLERSPRGIVLRITDDGVGFQNDSKLKGGLGIHIMNYRAQLIGGRLEMDSQKRRGTRVTCFLPGKPIQSQKKENGRSRLPAKIAKALAVLV